MNRREAIARAIMSEPWTDGPLPPRRPRGESRRQRALRWPDWLWDDVDEVARLSAMSRDEFTMLVMFKYIQDARITTSDGPDQRKRRE